MRSMYPNTTPTMKTRAMSVIADDAPEDDDDEPHEGQREAGREDHAHRLGGSPKWKMGTPTTEQAYSAHIPSWVRITPSGLANGLWYLLSARVESGTMHASVCL
jgi:hypothetical protein